MVVLALGLVWGLSLAVAASESPTPTPYDGSASPAVTGPSPAAGTVVYKVGWLAEPDNLNPFIGYLWSSFEVWDLAYESLVGYDYGTLTPTKGDQATGLATDWSVTPDGKTWTFTIRQDSTWSDGVPVTAKDVAFTYNYIIKNELANFTSYVQYIDKAVALNDTTVRFDCSQPKANMWSHWVPILPEHIWSKVSGKDAAAAYSNKPPFVGSGPFTCVTWKNNSYVEMVARKDYWRGAPKIDEILFEYYTNADTMVQDLKSGNIDGCSGLLSAQFRQLQGQPGIEARTVRTNGFDELGFNCYEGTSRGNPVLRDAKFRQALNWAVDKDRICAIVYGGHAEPATTIITALLQGSGLALGAVGRPEVLVRSGEGQAGAGRRGVHGHERRRRARVQGQAHRAAPRGALRIDEQPERRQAPGRLVRADRPQDRSPDHGRRRAQRRDVRQSER